MLIRSCLSIALLGCVAAPAMGQEYYSSDRTASRNNDFTTVNFTRAQDDGGAGDDEDSEAETIALLREQLKQRFGKGIRKTREIN